MSLRPLKSILAALETLSGTLPLPSILQALRIESRGAGRESGKHSIPVLVESGKHSIPGHHRETRQQVRGGLKNRLA